jgi:hypothetical protein
MRAFLSRFLDSLSMSIILLGLVLVLYGLSWWHG